MIQWFIGWILFLLGCTLILIFKFILTSIACFVYVICLHYAVASKLFIIKHVSVLFIAQNSDDQKEESDDGAQEEPNEKQLNAVYNLSIFYELVFESVPQLIISTINQVAIIGFGTNQASTTIYILQASGSAIMIVSELFPFISFYINTGSFVNAMQEKKVREWKSDERTWETTFTHIIAWFDAIKSKRNTQKVTPVTFETSSSKEINPAIEAMQTQNVRCD